MSYWKIYRKTQAEVRALACDTDSTSEEENDNISILHHDDDDGTPTDLHDHDDAICDRDVTSRQSEKESTTSDCHDPTNLEYTSPDTDIAFSESESEESADSRPDLHEKLASWAVTNKITRAAATELLSILREDGLDLPKDPRTLMKTPRTVTDIIDKCVDSIYT